MPVASADLSETDGLLSVSSTRIQGAAILEIVVNDPDLSATDTDLNGPTFTLSGNEYNLNQATNGKWYAYMVDNSVAVLMDADGTGMEYGFRCTTGLGIQTGPSTTTVVTGTANVVASGTNIFAEVLKTAGTTGTQAGGCLNANNMIGTLDNSPVREKLSDAVLQNAPSLSNWNGYTGNTSGVDLGQRGHSLNESGYGSWPYIIAVELDSDNLIESGADGITVEFGNTDDISEISITNQNPSDQTYVHVTVSDPALNIDPTTADVWQFDLNAADTATSVRFGNNGTSNAPQIPAQLTDRGCVTNCRLYTDTVASLQTGNATSLALGGFNNATMTESGPNTGVFESWPASGETNIITKQFAAADSRTVFSYAGESTDIIITYNNAVLELDAPSGDWAANDPITVRLTDPDMNKNPTSAEVLKMGNSTHVIPTIKVGSPLTLPYGNNTNLNKGDAQSNSGVQVGEGTGACNTETECSDAAYTLTVFNTSDNSERLRILHNEATNNGATTGSQAVTQTWINVTTGHSLATLVGLPGTVVLNYDISGPADKLGSTDINVYIVESGKNSTSNAGGLISGVTTGNARAGVVDLDDDSQWIKSRDISVGQTFGANNNLESDAVLVGVAFEITHPDGNLLALDEDYAIAADFCNFDQNNGSLVHNCIYRILAEETGENTGVFEGTVAYTMMSNSSTTDKDNGEHDGNDWNVEALMTDMAGQDVTVILMDAVSGSDSVRVVYNDTDALQVATKVGVQKETVTNTGIIDLDQDTYGVDDMATITIIDPDLNTDSSIRDTYLNSSTTFNITVTGSDAISTQVISGNMTIIETGPSTGEFVGTFKVPNKKGQDMELVYYESKDAGSSAVQYYDIATIVSNSGTISLDRSVYPVPFAGSDAADNCGASSGTCDLRTGAGGTAAQKESGNVTAWITVTDPDFTSDTLTTSAAGTAGTILVKLIQADATKTCFTAGSAGSASLSGSTVEEIGPLAEVEMGTSVYEASFTVDEVQHCGTAMKTIVSGDILQVEYEDTADDAGGTSTSYDSSTFDLRTGSLSVDKDVYVLGSDMVITLTDPDLNLDSTSSESYAMSLIEWDSSAASSTLLDNSNNANTFTSNPSSLEETGSDTGVFQTVTTLPSSVIGSTTIKYGESVTLTYVDVGLSGESTTEGDVLDVEASFNISNFGALVELDKAVYNWTDTVYFTITAPDHNTNTASEEQIGTGTLPIQVTTRVGKMCTTGDKTYLADEDGPDSGVFTGEVALKGFNHTPAHNTPSAATACGTTATGGTLATAGQTDGVSVSYEYNDATVVVASASISWNVAEAGFDSSAVSAGGSAVLTVVDADENTNNAIVDTFNVNVYSDSDNGGFILAMAETDEDTGVFEGTVFFTADGATSGSNLRVSEGDTVTAEYVDKTLPEPYTDSDTLTIASTATVGTAFPPLERAPAANARVVDAFGSSVAEVTVDQQVQIAADVSNGQSGDQAFAYLVQVQDGDGVTVSLAWITGSLTAGQSMSPALSWTPGAAGHYTATVFVWESVDNPTALSPTVSVDIDAV